MLDLCVPTWGVNLNNVEKINWKSEPPWYVVGDDAVGLVHVAALGGHAAYLLLVAVHARSLFSTAAAAGISGRPTGNRRTPPSPANIERRTPSHSRQPSSRTMRGQFTITAAGISCRSGGSFHFSSGDDQFSIAHHLLLPHRPLSWLNARVSKGLKDKMAKIGLKRWHNYLSHLIIIIKI